MSKKQPVKSTASTHKQSNMQPTKKLNAGNTTFNLSNKILIPAVILLFAVLAFLYCKPLIEGMRLSTHDSNQYIAINKESADLKATEGHVTMWSSRMFGGMPAYMMGGLEFSKLLNFSPLTIAYSILRKIPDPALQIFLLLICSFIGFYVLIKKVSYATLGSIAIAFCSYNFISLDAGHITKVNTIAMFLPLFAATWLTFRKNYTWGIILFMIFSFEIIAQRHVQIAYYSFILIGIYGIYEVITNSLKGEVKHALIAGSSLAIALVISGMMNFDNYLINDFSKDTTRGGDILNSAKMNPNADAGKNAPVANEKGVGFDYATNWSLGFEELGSLFVPNFVGGSSAAGLDENSDVYKTLSSKGVPPQQASQFVQRMPLYWGSEPFVQGPIYLGAIVLFLFVFGLFAYKGNLKWWIVGSIVFTILIALGKNLEVFYRLLYDFLPGFNKFRAPTMILALTEILMVVLGILGLKDFFDDAVTDKAERLKSLKLSGGIVGGVLIFFIVLGSVFSFQSKALNNGKSTDDQFKEQLTEMTGDQAFANDIYASLKSDRASAMRSDAIRSLLFVALAVALLFTFASSKINQPSYIAVALALLVLADFWSVSKRYLNDEDFAEQTAIEANTFPQTPADAAILAQNKDGARMADFTLDIFNSANPAYYHKTIGGYSPAKLRRYQDVIEHGLSYDFQLISKIGFAKANYMNMLNTKYLKQSPEANGVMQNAYALGNAWFVSDFVKVNSPEEEILKVRDINPARTAVVHKEFDAYLKDATPNTDSSAQSETRYIKQIDTKDPMKLEYSFKSSANEFVVFSEVIYRPNEDWISYIDGKPADHIRVNYILRGMKVNAGEHKITFEFKPKLYAITNNVLLLGNALFYLLIAGLLFLFFRNKKQDETTLTA
jgi:hypothetical protein